MKALSDEKILDSWHKNAAPWSLAVREGQIDSRRLVTDSAIVGAVEEYGRAYTRPSVLDIGCGEGWLARALSKKDMVVTGVDAVPALIETARNAGGGHFHTLSYEDIANGGLSLNVDIAVSNFALLGCESVQGVFAAVPARLNPAGLFFVQTLHPLSACGELAYRDGWRHGSWDGFSDAFTDPAPWYFRTLQSWVKLFSDAGMRLLEIREPPHPKTGKPASIIFIARL